MGKFDYNKAVREDAEYFIKNVITDWSTYDTVDKWASEIAKDTAFRSYVCGMSDDSMFDYQGDTPVDTVHTVPSMGEVLDYMTRNKGFEEAEEVFEDLKEYGIKAIDGWARAICLNEYVKTENFKNAVSAQYEYWHAREFTKRREKLICMLKRDLITPEEAFDMYDTALLELKL